MSNSYFKRWGFQIINLSITWYDLWEKKFILEITLWKAGNPYLSTHKFKQT